MIEGQEDVEWRDWLALAAACERLGFEALFRSDHYLSVDAGRERGGLDAWSTICGLAAGRTMERMVRTFVAPNPREASRSAFGTSRSISSVVRMIVGIIMIPNAAPPANAL